MQYAKITFLNAGQDISEILIALLAEAGYEGFEEEADNLLAYIPMPQLAAQELDDLSEKFGLKYEVTMIPAQNWNALWESNFRPVILEGFCTIRAHFHDIKVTTPFDIVVTPKMSFGTGHHATTQLMMTMMREVDFKGHSVLDFGTGTGVLAILAEMLGAGPVTAIDNDEWSVENAGENIARNRCSCIAVMQGSLDDAPEGTYDIILANINRHILLQYMEAMYLRLKPGGQLLMSGLLADDQEIIRNAAEQNGFIFSEMKELNGWIALLFGRE